MQNTTEHLSMVFFTMIALWCSFMWNSFETIAISDYNFAGRKKITELIYSQLFTGPKECQQEHLYDYIFSAGDYANDVSMQLTMSPFSLWFFRTNLLTLHISCLASSGSREEIKNTSEKYVPLETGAQQLMYAIFCVPWLSRKTFILADKSTCKLSYEKYL